MLTTPCTRPTPAPPPPPVPGPVPTIATLPALFSATRACPPGYSVSVTAVGSIEGELDDDDDDDDDGRGWAVDMAART